MNENAKTKLVLEYTGMDDFSCPVYKDQFGKLWKDIDLGKEPEPNLYSLSFNHIDGEPSPSHTAGVHISSGSVSKKFL